MATRIAGTRRTGQGSARLTRRGIALGGVAAAAALGIACAPADSQSAAGQSAAKSPVKLTYMSSHLAGSVGFQKDEVNHTFVVPPGPAS